MSLEEQLERAHRKWLGAFDTQQLNAWNDNRAADPEAALCEAAVRDVTDKNVLATELGKSRRG